MIKHICFAFLFVFTILVSNEISLASETEIELLKKQMKQMERNMELMNQKIIELEDKNRRLETQTRQFKTYDNIDQGLEVEEQAVDEQTVEQQTDTVVETQEPAGQTFLGRFQQTFNPEISVIGTFAAAYYSLDDPVVFAENDPEDTGFNLQELEIGFQSYVDSYFRFDAFLSINREGIEIEEAYAATLLSLPANSQFRLGVIRSKFGRINRLHRHSQNFVTLPIVAAEFLGEHLNPTQIEANFLIPVPWYMEFSASGGSPDVETASFARDEDGNDLGLLLYNFHLANFFEISDSLGMSLGGSFATGSNGTEPGNRTNLYGVDLFAKYRPQHSHPYRELQLQAEFMYRDAETEEGDRGDWGLYAQAVYRFAKRWNAGIRYGITDTNDPISEDDEHEDEFLEVASGEEEDGHGHGDGELGLFGKQYRVSGMLTFNPTEFSRIRLQYDYLNQDFADDQHGLFLQFQYAIGAHGAHPY